MMSNDIRQDPNINYNILKELIQNPILKHCPEKGQTLKLISINTN